MDTSETYVKMCEKAEEILCKGDISPGNIWFHSFWGAGLAIWYWPCLHCDRNTERAFYFDGYGIKLINECGPMIWLPRQDQLQEMVSNDLNELIKVFFNEMKWGEHGNLISKNPMYVIDLKSMEQLWLAFVMKECFGKIWLNGEWVKEKEST